METDIHKNTLNVTFTHCFAYIYSFRHSSYTVTHMLHDQHMHTESHVRLALHTVQNYTMT